MINAIAFGFNIGMALAALLEGYYVAVGVCTLMALVNVPFMVSNKKVN